MGLKTDLANASSGKYLDDGGAWRLFVIDHIAAIQNTSRVVYPDATVIFKYRYDVRRYLRYNSVTEDLAWIFILINRLNSERDFDVVQPYYVPIESEIDELYHLYITTSQVT